MRGLVSVIIPCYNRLDFLRECLLSVARQTYRNIEVIVVDDASEMDIPSVLNDVGRQFESVPKYVRIDTNLGPGGAREAGRRVANGGFICYLDSDDLWHEEKVAEQVECLSRNQFAGMCYCITMEFKSSPFNEMERIRSRSDQQFANFLPHIIEGRPWSTSSCMWTRSATDLIGPWLFTRNWEDYEYDYRAECHGVKVAFVPRILCFYRRSHGLQQLSQIKGQEANIQKARSLLEITRHLECHGKLNDSSVRRHLSRQLYVKGINLLTTETRDIGLQCLIRTLQISTLRSRVGLAAWSILLMRDLVGLPQLARFGQILRRRLLR